jgi:hypothetical protein
MEKFTELPDLVILHCSDTEDGEVLDAESIKRYHKSVNGWDDIGYHFVIERVGDSLRLVQGRDIRYVGSHCKGQNHRSIGVCVVGKFERVVPDPVLDFTAKCMAQIMYSFHLPPSALAFHRDFTDAKTCPGTAWKKDYLQTLVGEYMMRLGGLTRRP